MDGASKVPPQLEEAISKGRDLAEEGVRVHCMVHHRLWRVGGEAAEFRGGSQRDQYQVAVIPKLAMLKLVSFTLMIW